MMAWGFTLPSASRLGLFPLAGIRATFLGCLPRRSLSVDGNPRAVRGRRKAIPILSFPRVAETVISIGSLANTSLARRSTGSKHQRRIGHHRFLPALVSSVRVPPLKKSRPVLRMWPITTTRNSKSYRSFRGPHLSHTPRQLGTLL
ncbi:hypothetical protein B0T26DRAFT_276280 [Lasiosphaeria miniovina]|uniref:Uncharacterized protein n=1 Tax=Lasiosphaeria miniovina TaxID=1954250 RepID=A0AA40AJR6_9PEZI|nr:uncharacterized protein B0T26DRAFT_276280 [Lasiosphaeria miniovina]KAK0717030.1 hypothetical protein B0T26DRAFT_276280 [Lasiosphaeria miniovina]